MLRLGKKAQTTAEYAILIALVIGAVVAMQVYVRRGLQGRVRDVVDDITVGGQVDNPTAVENIFISGQYEPYYVSSNATTNQTSNQTESLQAGGAVGRTSNVATTSNRTQETGWKGEE